MILSTKGDTNVQMETSASMPRAMPSIAVVAAAPSLDRFYLVRKFEPGTIHRPTFVSLRAGGKGFNVAAVARRLGARVTAYAPLAGETGRLLMKLAEADGIVCRPTWIAGELRSCLSVSSEDDGLLTEFYEPPPPMESSDWERYCAAVADCAPRRGDSTLISAVSGRVPPGIPDHGWRTLVEAAGAHGARVLVDSDGPGIAAALPTRPWLVKVNIAEARAAARAPDRHAPEEIAAELQRRGAQLVVVTLGADGAVGLDNAGRVWRVPPVPRRGQFPVGSGDAFLAGMAVSLAMGDSFEGALRAAAGAAIASAEVPAAGVLSAERARALAAATSIEALVGLGDQA